MIKSYKITSCKLPPPPPKKKSHKDRINPSYILLSIVDRQFKENEFFVTTVFLLKLNKN